MIVILLFLFSSCAFFFDVKKEQQVMTDKTYTIGSKPSVPDSVRMERVRLRHERKMTKLRAKKKDK